MAAVRENTESTEDTSENITTNPVFMELCQTEKTYNQGIKTASHFLKFAEGRFSEAFREKFVEFETISDLFLENIQNTLENASAQLPKPEKAAKRLEYFNARINLLQRFMGVFKEYLVLFERYKTALEDNPQLFATLNHVMQAESPSVSPIESLLILPIQRAPRYKLLAQELLKIPKGQDVFLQLSFKGVLEEVIAGLADANKKPSYRFGDLLFRPAARRLSAALKGFKGTVEPEAFNMHAYQEAKQPRVATPPKA
jgi:hypothetical protein